MNRYFLLAFPLALSLSFTNAQGGQACNSTSLCPSEAPCCSSFGFCGTGDFCLGGCNPLASNALDSCRPTPVCQSATHTFQDNSRIFSNASLFDGNATAYDWVVNQGNIMNTNTSGGELALLLTENNGGTRVSSTRYLHYGTITATLKASHWQGVVTAFITMSGVKDEIDWEWPGANTTSAQSNMFWQGVIPQQTIGQTEGGVNDTFGSYHDYTIDWQPDTLTFSIDNQTVRTIKKSDTIDSGGIAHYPSTPSAIELSIWPAGINTSAPGTVQWAGGMINWDDPDYKAAGHFYTLIKKVSIQCADPQSPGPNVTSYVYGTNSSKDTPSVSFSNASVLVNGAPLASVPLPRTIAVGIILAFVLSLFTF